MAHPISGFREPTIGCSLDRQDTPRDERVYSTVVDRHAIFVRKVRTFVYSPPIESLPPMHRLGVMRGVTGPAGTGPATADPVRGCGEEATGRAILRRRDPAETQYDDWECHDLLDAGRAGYRYGFAALNLGLAAGDRRGWKAPWARPDRWYDTRRCGSRET
jgi:hypothetical protein